MSNLPEFASYDDAKLVAARDAVNAEIVRRARIAAIPEQIRGMAREYIAAGGDAGDLSLEAEPETEPVEGE